MLEKNQIVSLTTAEMQLHFEVKKYFEEEKNCPKIPWKWKPERKHRGRQDRQDNAPVKKCE